MWRLVVTAVFLAVFLTGCSADKEFEKDILGHPAPESPADGGWSRTTPPPPPPPAEHPLGTPAPVASTPAPAPAPTQPGVMAPVAPRPVAQPAPVPARAQAPRPAPAIATPGAMVLTFQVGSFAHAENAKALVARLAAKGYTTRQEQGQVNNRTFYTVYAAKAGSRAALEGELFVNGVTEPLLVAEQPVGGAHAGSSPAVHEPNPAPSKTFAAPSPKPRTPKSKTGAKTKAQPAPKANKTSTKVRPVPSATTLPPPVSQMPPLSGVEPAPPLPDGYVPPPPKGSGS